MKAIVHVTKSKFFNLPCPKQVQLFISICIHGKFVCQPHLPLLAFKKTLNNLSHKLKLTSLKGEALNPPSTILSNHNVQQNVRYKLDFVESK